MSLLVQHGVDHDFNCTLLHHLQLCNPVGSLNLEKRCPYVGVYLVYSYLGQVHQITLFRILHRTSPVAADYLHLVLEVALLLRPGSTNPWTVHVTSAGAK